MSVWKRWLQQPQRVWLRRAIFQVHLWTGLALGLYVVVLSATGSALVYRRELVARFRTPVPVVDQAARQLSIDELRSIVEREYPGYQITNIKPAITRRTAVVNVYVEMAGEKDRGRVLDIIAEHLGPEQRIFVGVIDPIDPSVESPEEVRDRVLEAAERLPADRLGTTDDCGFAPFADDTSTSRDVAFEKIRARIEGTRLAGERLGI